MENLTTEEEKEKTLYKYYLKNCIKQRNKAIEILKKRDFASLQRNYINWCDKKIKTIPLKSKYINHVIKELASIKLKDNESEPILSCYVKENEDMFGGNIKNSIKITSFKYTIVSIEKCKNLAKSYTNNSLWKIKYQPNGKDAIGCLKIINKQFNAK